MTTDKFACGTCGAEVHTPKIDESRIQDIVDARIEAAIIRFRPGLMLTVRNDTERDNFSTLVTGFEILPGPKTCPNCNQWMCDCNGEVDENGERKGRRR